MRFAVDAWSPSYGSAVEVDRAEPTDVDVFFGTELEPAHWQPLQPSPAPDASSEPLEPTSEPALVFVDGVRRIDARLWIGTGSDLLGRELIAGTDDGDVVAGVCASYAAGAMRCDGSARLVLAVVQRAAFAPTKAIEPIVTRHGSYAAHVTASAAPEAVSLAVQERMSELEGMVALEAAGPPPLAADGTPAIGSSIVVVDGPLRRGHPGHAVGFVKTQHVDYLPPPLRAVRRRLAVGERTPLLTIGGRFTRHSWYVRLATLPASAGGHAEAGIARCECSAAIPVDTAIELADVVTRLLPRYASAPHKDRRAPQNLYPIAGLERELRRRLGDPLLIERALRAAAHEPLTAAR